MLSQNLDLNIFFSLQYGNFPSIGHLSLILTSSEVLATYPRTEVYTAF